MQEEIGAGQGAQRLRTQEVVGVGDDADAAVLGGDGQGSRQKGWPMRTSCPGVIPLG